MVKKSEKWEPLKARYYASSYLGKGSKHMTPFAAEGWVRKNSDFAPLNEDEKRAELVYLAEKLLNAPVVPLPADIEDFV